MSALALGKNVFTTLRCYTIGGCGVAATQETGRRLTYPAIVEAVNTNIVPPPMVFARRPDLEANFNALISGRLGRLSQWLHMIAFCRGLKITWIGQCNLPEPGKRYDQDEISRKYCEGFPVPRPSRNGIDTNTAYSFSQEEEDHFLLSFSNYSGRMVVINLEGRTGGSISQDECLFRIHSLTVDLKHHLEKNR